MLAKLKFAMLALALSLGLSGCCAPKELFSWIDRNCFYADWTSHYNCVNRSCYGGRCQHCGSTHHGEMLVLGSAGSAEETPE